MRHTGRVLPDGFGEGQVWIGLGVPALGDERVGLLRVEQKQCIGRGGPFCQGLAILVGGLVSLVGVPVVEVAGVHGEG